MKIRPFSKLNIFFTLISYCFYHLVLTNAATTSTTLTKMAHRVADIMPGIAATALDSAQKVSINNTNLANNISSQHHHAPSLGATLVTTTSATNMSDVLYRSILTPNSPNLTPLTPVTSTTISSPTGILNEQPPADLFDSEDGDALSVATTTETPTPPPSLNGDTVGKVNCNESKYTRYSIRQDF